MPEFFISHVVKTKLPGCRLGIIQAEVQVEPASGGLLEEINHQINRLRNNLTIDHVSSIPLIEQTKAAYRSLGKDPTRYRPSAEALTRRVVQGKGLYSVNNIVDLLNLTSIRSAYSIGGYDADCIDGNIFLSTGEEDEPYDAIGRGFLNIYQLPVLRDSRGAFGSPTSDSKRTMVRDSTVDFLMVYFDFFPDDQLHKTLGIAEEYLIKYGKARKVKIVITD
jgi:DNA/RNA-binding domain of Phe-tRNA-synthetase-like protein